MEVPKATSFISVGKDAGAVTIGGYNLPDFLVAKLKASATVSDLLCLA
jgi:hypothetical protein